MEVGGERLLGEEHSQGTLCPHDEYKVAVVRKVTYHCPQLPWFWRLVALLSGGSFSC